MRRSKKTSQLRVAGLCEGNSPGPVNSPHKGPVTRNICVHLMTSSWKALNRNYLISRYFKLQRHYNPSYCPQGSLRYIGSGRNWHLLSFSLWDGWYSSVVGTPTWSVKIRVWYRCLVATWCRPIHGYLMLNIFRHSSRLRNTLYVVKLILWLGKLIISIVSVACKYWSMTCPQTWFG